MRLPIESLLVSDLGVGLVVALVTGFFFGFVLERAGFGRSTKLAGQFYLTDMTVFKVMFSAIITAMIGLVIAGGLGVVDLEAVLVSGASFTYFWPMLVGGLLLGVGFITSGYCPGTSIVASASGHLDGMVTFLGVIVGSVIFGELYPLIGSWATSSNWGHLFLPEALGVSRAVLALAITVVAVGAFLGAEWVERRFNKSRDEEIDGSEADEVVRTTQKRTVFASLTAAAALGLVATLAWPSTAASGQRHPEGIDVEELARRVVNRPWSVRILDLRGEEAWREGRISGSEPAGQERLASLGLRYVQPGTDLVVVGAETVRTLPPEIAAYRGTILSLRGGFAAWQRYALTAPRAPAADADEDARSEYRFRAALQAFLTGSQAAPPPPTPVRTVGPRRPAGGGGCS
jgi:hypothetical protein